MVMVTRTRTMTGRVRAILRPLRRRHLGWQVDPLPRRHRGLPVDSLPRHHLGRPVDRLLRRHLDRLVDRLPRRHLGRLLPPRRQGRPYWHQDCRRWSAADRRKRSHHQVRL